MPDGPLRESRVAVPSSGAASECARALLTCLGADVATGGDDLGLADADDAADWAGSGAMALTGPADGPPRVIDAAPASLLRAALAVLARQAARRRPDCTAARRGRPAGRSAPCARRTAGWASRSRATATSSCFPH